MMAGPPPIFVGVPVYRGWDLVDETLRSIRDQQFRDFRVLISVDGGDERSAEVCAKYLEDSRFELVLQRERLGWARNLNWLMDQSRGEFFCYWQQDDICATSYFQVLYDHAIEHPEAACVYADVQWFGSRIHCDRLPSVTGPPAKRVLELIEHEHSAPFRGLVRRSVMERVGPLRINSYDSRLEDFVWVAKLAREGELHRVSGTLYFKRCHEANAHSYSPVKSQDELRAVWIEYGLGLLEAALPVSGAWRAGLLNLVLERLIFRRPERSLAYDAWQNGVAELSRFAADFVDAANRQFDEDAWKSTVKLPDPLAVLDLLTVRQNGIGEDPAVQALVDNARSELRFRGLRERAALDGRTELWFAAGSPGTALLCQGWSTPEEWGVWSDGPTARLRLPILRDGGIWRVVLHGRGLVDGLAKGKSRSIVARIGGKMVAQWAYSARSAQVVGELTLTGLDGSRGNYVDLDFPDAVSPMQLGLNSDSRRLGLALEKIVLERCGAGT